LEPGTLKGAEQVQGKEPQPVQETASTPDANVPAQVGDAPAAEPIGGSAQPRPTMSRLDVYAQPMRAGRPVSDGPFTRFTNWVKLTVSSELQRREWAVDEALAHAPAMTRPNTVAVISPKGGVGKTTISFVLGNLLAEQLRMRVVALDANPDFGTLSALAPDEHRSTRSLADLLADSTQIESPAESISSALPPTPR
jgi:Mrp family chromosome partitioning ATPase